MGNESLATGVLLRLPKPCQETESRRLFEIDFCGLPLDQLFCFALGNLAY